MGSQLYSSSLCSKFVLSLVFLGLLYFKAFAAELQCYDCKEKSCSDPKIQNCSSALSPTACFTRYSMGDGKALMKGCRSWDQDDGCHLAGPQVLKMYNCYCREGLCNGLSHIPTDSEVKDSLNSISVFENPKGPENFQRNARIRTHSESSSDAIEGGGTSGKLQCYYCVKDCSNPEIRECSEDKNACFTLKAPGGSQATMKGCRSWTSEDMTCLRRSPDVEHCYCGTSLCNDLKHGV
ncbi:unnamed protein product [Allacma fusca]|uniref:Sodefrin-like factor n=1 Tax=Allacma fusca TaxID=39272 RepID=A0A8J2KSK1_9HEXA|nr:unnamed protein product [Allacma fusca]